jgi:hypothetical protein
MKEIKIKDKTYLFVEVLDDTHDFYYDSWFTKYINHSKGSIKLDIDTKLIATTKDITEEQAGSIVFKYTDYETEHEQLLHEMYEDYLEKGNYWVQDSSGIKLWAFKTTKESLQSLIQSLGLDITKNYLILLKK